MTKILDQDLWFLEECKNEELEILFNILSFEQNQSKRNRNRLLNSLEAQIYDRDYYKYSDKIGIELQVIANPTIAGFLREEKIPYREILKEIFQELNFNFEEKKSVIYLENKLIEQLHEKALGIKNSGISSLPFNILVEESFNDNVKNCPRLRCIIPSVIYLSLLRANLGKDSLKKGKNTILI